MYIYCILFQLSNDASGGGFHVAIDPNGLVLATGGNDGFVYLVSALPSSGFDVLGVLTLDGGVGDVEFTALTAFFNPDNKKIKVAGLLAEKSKVSPRGGATSGSNEAIMATKFFSIEFNSALAKDPTPFHTSESRDLNGPMMAKMVVALQYPSEGLALGNAANIRRFVFRIGLFL